jgi:hypothetical protein
LKTKSKIFIATTLSRLVRAARRLVGLGDTLEAVRSALRWRLDLKEGIDFSIYLLGAFEPVTVAACRRLIRRGDVILDIGANIGALCLPMASMTGEAGKVYAFEPTDFAFGKLAANLALNPEIAARVTASQVMLTDTDDPIIAGLFQLAAPKVQATARQTPRRGGIHSRRAAGPPGRLCGVPGNSQD